MRTFWHIIAMLATMDFYDSHRVTDDELAAYKAFMKRRGYAEG